MTELTNGKLDVWDIDAETLTTHTWLQETAHDTPPQGIFFLLIDRDESEYFRYLEENGREPAYVDGYGWQIYFFDSWDELVTLKQQAQQDA